MKTAFEIIIFKTKQDYSYYVGLVLMTIGMILISTSKEKDAIDSYKKETNID